MFRAVFFEIEAILAGDTPAAWAIGVLRGYDLLVGFGTHDPARGNDLLARIGPDLPNLQHVIGDPRMRRPDNAVAAVGHAVELLLAEGRAPTCLWRPGVVHDALAAAGFEVQSPEALRLGADAPGALRIVR